MMTVLSRAVSIVFIMYLRHSRVGNWNPSSSSVPIIIVEGGDGLINMYVGRCSLVAADPIYCCYEMITEGYRLRDVASHICSMKSNMGRCFWVGICICLYFGPVGFLTVCLMFDSCIFFSYFWFALSSPLSQFKWASIYWVCSCWKASLLSAWRLPSPNPCDRNLCHPTMWRVFLTNSQNKTFSTETAGPYNVSWCVWALVPNSCSNKF